MWSNTEFSQLRIHNGSTFELGFSLKHSGILKKSFFKFIGVLNVFITKSSPRRLFKPISPFKNIFNRQTQQTNFRRSSWSCRIRLKLAYVNSQIFGKAVSINLEEYSWQRPCTTLYNLRNVALSHHHFSMTEFAVNIVRLCIGITFVQNYGKSKGVS